MKRIYLLILVLLLISLEACTPKNGNAPGLVLFGPTPTLPPPAVTIIPAPDAQAAVRAFLDAWKSEDYASMYALLSKVSRESISQEDFAARYTEAMSTMSLTELNYEVLSALISPYTAQVAFRVTYKTALLGELQREMVARLSLENETWRIQWDDGLILPELSGGNRLAMECRAPARGDIYDRNGQPLVAQSDAYAFGLIPGELGEKARYSLFSELQRLTGVPSTLIEQMVNSYGPQMYVPVGEAPKSIAEPRYEALSKYDGLRISPYTGRFYFENLAAQTLGYVLSVPAEELAEYKRKGYCGNEKIGYSGLEKWGEEYLAGKRGGSLYVIDPAGNVVTRLGQSEPQPAASLYLTIDRNLQRNAEKAIAGFNGAVVVLERDTGRVLAMASSPTFDANLFAPENPHNGYLLAQVLNDPTRPMYNRATQGEYPLGSVFKIITFSAALESGLYTPESTYDCQYEFTELTDRTLYDWTWEYCQNELREDPELKECKTKPSGLLTLPEGLMRSCNPWFWHIGLGMYRAGHTTNISNMARAFGLGEKTGIGIEESAGNISDPANDIDATNSAIGQGSVLVTPLQVATFIAAIGNGGTLYRPQLVERVQPLTGDPIVVFKPEARGTLPLSPETLKLLQETMISVVQNPRGTANFRLRGLRIPVAGKTGTAETGAEPHAWFAGYTYANIDGVPDIAIAVILENAGQGSDWAAPVFKRIVESYFVGSPQTIYWWESSIGVPKPPETATPTPQP